MHAFSCSHFDVNYLVNCYKQCRRNLVYWLNSLWMRSALFWDITQPMLAIPYRRFGTTYESHLKGQGIQEKSRYLPTTNQPTNQIANQPINRPMDKPTNQPTDLPTNQPTNQSTNQPTNRPTNQPTNQTNNKPTNRLTDRPTNQPNNQPAYLPKR